MSNKRLDGVSMDLIYSKGSRGKPRWAQPLLSFYSFYVFQSVWCNGTRTPYPETVKCFYLLCGWISGMTTVQADYEKQEHTGYVPSPRSPGPLSSFPSVSAALWCRGAPRSPPATAWCVWSAWSGKRERKVSRYEWIDESCSSPTHPNSYIILVLLWAQHNIFGRE